MKTTTQMKYMPQLDSIKLLAMLLVFSTHCYFLQLSPETSNLYSKYFVFSGIGVEFFIMISGFFSAYTFKEIDYKDYLSKKFYRLFPVHWICLIIGAYLLGIHCGKIPFTTPVSVVLCQSLIPGCGDTNPPCWTLSTLFILYLVTPFLNNVFIKLNRNYLLGLAVVLAVFSTIINSLFYTPTNKIMFWFLYVSPYFRIITYSIGMLVGIRAKTHETNRFNFSMSCLREVLSLALLLGAVVILKKAPGFWYTLPLLFLIECYGRCDIGIVSKLLSVRFIQWFSKLSFCFYLIHFPILQYVEYLVVKHNILESNKLYAILAASFVISLVAAYLLRRFVEIPSSKYRIIKIQNKI